MATPFFHNRIYGPGIVPADGARYNRLNWEFPPVAPPIPCESWDEATIIGGGSLPSTFPQLFPAEWATVATNPSSPRLVTPGVMLFENLPGGQSRRRANTGDCGSVTALDATLASRATEMTIVDLTSAVEAGTRAIQVLFWQSWTVIASPVGDGYQFRVNCVKLNPATAISVGQADGFGQFAYEIWRYVDGVGTRVTTGNTIGNITVNQKIRGQIRWNAAFTQAQITGFANGVQVVQFTDNAPRGIGGVIGVGRGNAVNGGPTPGPIFKDLEVFLIDPLP